MRKLIWACASVIVLAGLVGFLVFGNRDRPTNNNVEVTTFLYSHSGSSIVEIYAYEIDKDEETGETVVNYEFCNGNETYTLPVDGELMQGLTAVMNAHKLLKWDGFQKSNSLVSDGSGFHLEIEFADGTRITASGSNRFPDGYREAADAIDNLFCGYLKKHGIEKEGGIG